LDGTVKSLNVSVVIWPAEAGVANRHSLLLQLLFKVLPKLWAVVGLHHMEGKAKVFSSLQDCSGG
jgi:hypothetical protein